jgi:hypothetical protein
VKQMIMSITKAIRTQSAGIRDLDRKIGEKEREREREGEREREREREGGRERGRERSISCLNLFFLSLSFPC